MLFLATHIVKGTATAWECLFAFDTMIFLLTFVKTLKERRLVQLVGHKIPLTDLIFRDGKPSHSVHTIAQFLKFVATFPGAIYYA